MEPIELVEALKSLNFTIAVAESCTGGLISKMITDVPGASAVFGLGITAYSNGIKEKVLKVKSGTLKKYGAVSRQCAAEMAEGARTLADAQIAVAVTGIAGPDGGTPQKPVGTVCVGVSARGKNYAQKYLFTGDRREIRIKSAEKALETVLAEIKNNKSDIDKKGF